MATKPMKTIKLPGLPDTYTFLQEADVDAKIENMAVKDGYYQDMTVGDAEQLVSSLYVEDNAPYKFRTSGGSADIGNREYVDKIVGGTIAWNQLASLTDGTSTANGLTIVKDSANGTVTINGTATDRTIASSPVGSAPVNVGDVILVTGCPTTGGWSTYNLLEGYGAFVDVGLGAVGKMTRTALTVQIIVHKDTECNNLVLRPQCFNLTKMFGSTIADAVYAMNQATAGAGAQWFRKLFPADHYAYNAGELISVSGLQSHDMVGFNLWDEETESGYWDTNTGEKKAGTNWKRCKNPVPVFQNTAYFFKATIPASGSFGSVIYLDSEGKAISHTESTSSLINRVITTPAGCAFIVFYANKNWFDNPICINLSWSGTRNGEYEPYEKHSYPLDSTLTLRGIPKLSADNQLYFDGDEYLPEGKVNRRYGVVDLGTLNWSYVASGAVPYFHGSGISDIKQITSPSSTIGMITEMYSPINQSNWNSKDKVICKLINNTNILVHDESYSDAATFKTAMSGVYLVYELATPTEETAEPFNEVQLVNDWGTEEYVSGTICPVGHETRYPANLRDKLQHLPDLASADGYYVVQQTGSQMSLVHFRIPQAPSTDGTYTLKATVSGGVPTYTWEEVTE